MYVDNMTKRAVFLLENYKKSYFVNLDVVKML